MSPVTLDPSGPFFVLTPSGRLDLAQAMGLVHQMLQHPEFRPGMPALWDLRDCDLDGLHPAEMRSLARFNGELSASRGRARAAFLTASDLAFGLSRMYEVLGKVPNLEYRSFRDPDAARAWLHESWADEDEGSAAG